MDGLRMIALADRKNRDWPSLQPDHTYAQYLRARSTTEKFALSVAVPSTPRPPEAFHVARAVRRLDSYPMPSWTGVPKRLSSGSGSSA